MQLYQKWKAQQVDRHAFTEFKNDIALCNLHTLRQIAWVGTVGGLLLVLACLPPFRLMTMIYGYLAITVLFGTLAALSYTLLEKRLGFVLPVYYAFVILFLALSIVMGTVWGRDSNAITFIILVVVLPLLIIDRPARMNAVFGTMCLAFCIIDFHVKRSELCSMDVANCVVFYLLSIVISRQTINVKLSDIIIKHELKQQRDMDMLTKLSNRGAFERHVDRYIHASNKDAVMLIMDLDNFKAVNDQMGHEYGDLVLKRVGEYLQAAFRRGDIVSRLGGDEFVAFLPAVGELGVITEKVEALIERVSGVRQELALRCSVGASVGLAQYPQNGCSFEELYRRADAALYSAKRSGKGTFVVYDEKLTEALN